MGAQQLWHRGSATLFIVAVDCHPPDDVSCGRLLQARRRFIDPRWMRYRCCGVFRYSDSFISSGLNDNQRQKTSVGPCAGELSEDHVNRDAIPQATASRDVALRSRIE